MIATAPGLFFGELNHEYRFNGEVIPSVTQNLEFNRYRSWRQDPKTGLWQHITEYVRPDHLEYARQRGTAVHLATHYDDEGTLDDATVSTAIWPYVLAWRAFKLARKVEILEMEKRRVHSRLKYAGTLDRIALVDLGRRRGKVVLDLKTGDQTGVELQLAGYLDLYRDETGNSEVLGRWSVVLHPERRIPYTVHEFTNPRDFRIFRAALDVTWSHAAMGHTWRSHELRAA
jgi:hypothetical protein